MATALRAVLFDFDGTLGRYQPAHLELYVQAAAEEGIEVTVEALRGGVATGWAPWETPLGVDHAASSGSEHEFAKIRALLHIDRYRSAGVAADPAVLQRVADRLVEIEADPKNIALYDDARPALERVRAAGLDALIVSNHIWRLPEIVEALGLYCPQGGGLAARVLTSARVGYRKPHPKMFAAAIAAAGATPDALLYVGDNMAHDVEGARASGMRAMLLDRAGTSGDRQAIRSLLDLPL